MNLLEKPIPSRPYSKVKGSEPSVTGIIGEMMTPGLDWGAAKLCAQLVAYHPEEIQDMDPDTMYHYVRKYFNGIWQSRMDVGSCVHTINEAWIKGEKIDVEDVVASVKAWEHHVGERLVTIDGYLAGLHKFYEQWQPSEFTTEEIVRTPGQYVGTRDMLGKLNGDLWLLDVKCTAERDPKKAVYHDKWALQLAAYNAAREVLTYCWNADNKLEVESVALNTPADHCGIIHLRGDGEYVLYEVDCGPDVLDAFHSLREFKQWHKSPKPPTAMNGRKP